MNIIPTKIDGLVIIEPKVFGDARGYFLETWQASRYAEAGIPPMVQDNLSYSRRGTMRGLHFQEPHSQSKLVYVIQGSVFDVAVDIRKGSKTFGQWEAIDLTGDNQRQFYVPAGFAHGFCVTSDTALFAYKCTDYYHPECEKTIQWNDPTLAIPWPTQDTIVSEKDAKGMGWKEFISQR